MARLKTLLMIILVCCFGNILNALAQQNPFGNILGGMIAAGMIQNAQTQWQNLPEPRKSCLLGQLSRQNINVNALVQQAIGPEDQRLAQLNYPCQQQQIQHDAEQQKIQDQKDVEEEAAKNAEAERIAEEKRQKQQQLAEERQREKDRVEALKNIKLSQSIACDIKDHDRIYSSICDEYLVPKLGWNGTDKLTVKQAIAQKLLLDDLRVMSIEHDDAKSRRLEMMGLYPHLAKVNLPSISCDTNLTSRSKIICNSYELSFLDELLLRYREKSKEFETKGDVSKREKEILNMIILCKSDASCLKNSLVSGVDLWQSYLAEKGISVLKYSETIDDRRSAEKDAQDIDDENIRKEKERLALEKAKKDAAEEAERQNKIQLAIAERIKKEQEALKLKQEQEAAALQLKIKQEELAKLQQERELKEKKKIDAWQKYSSNTELDNAVNFINQCEASNYAALMIDSASSVKDRKNIREQIRVSCRCVSVAIEVAKSLDEDISQAVNSFIILEKSQQPPEIFVKAQEDCHVMLNSSIVDRWKNN